MVNKQEKDYLTGKKVFRLDVELENKDELKEVSVYPRKVNEEIWNEVISNSCLGKKYLFSCEKITTALHLKT
jgi:hypothetical protein